MPRPTKCRRVCHYPQTVEFIPNIGENMFNPIVLTIDEYETIRLIDKEGMSQEQTCEFMQVARTTVQKIYETARHKIAQCLVDGIPLRIEGGQYRICDGTNTACEKNKCIKQEILLQYNEPKGDNIMRIAVTYENGNVFQHFGHTEQFKIYDVQQGKVTACRVINTNGSGHGALAEILRTLKVDTLICGGIGGGAKNALANAGIKLFGGVSGNADMAVSALIADNLSYNPDVHCDHHGEDHHHHDGECGHHGCGHHSCK